MRKQFLFINIFIAAVVFFSVAMIVPIQLLLASNATGNATGQQGLPMGQQVVPTGQQGATNPSGYLNNLYKWLLGAVGISALFAFVMGGVLYMFSGTNLTKVEQAKGWIWNGLGGIVLAAISYLLLYTINPDLVGGFDLDKVVEKAVNSGQQR